MERFVKVGGIISVATLVSEHGDAITYDLLTKTKYTLDDVGGALSWSTLYSFIKGLGADSAFASEIGDRRGWESTTKTNSILADIYDLLQLLHEDLVGLSGGKPKKVKPYPRPKSWTDKDKNEQKIGKDALPTEDLHKWIKERQHG